MKKILVVMAICTSSCMAQSTRTVPACPKGAVERNQKANGETYYRCEALGQKTDAGFDSCYEWENGYWNPDPGLPCGSRAAVITDKQYLANVKEEKEHDCHGAQALAAFMKTNAETRGAFALKGATVISQQARVMITAAGDDKEYLLFSADPQDKEAVNFLTQTWLLYERSADLRVRACGEGFKEIQFITRDDNFNQKMIGRVVPSTKELVHQAIKSNAQPMK